MQKNSIFQLGFYMCYNKDTLILGSIHFDRVEYNKLFQTSACEKLGMLAYVRITI